MGAHPSLPPRRLRLAGLTALALLVLPAARARAGGLQDLEKEFRGAIERVTPATVICVARGVPADRSLPSSGVIVTRAGHVLSDGDVGRAQQGEGADATHVFQDDVEVRVPNLARGGFATYAARVLHRDRRVDTALLRIDTPPRGGFPGFLPPATSHHLQVGDFVFAMGNAFGLSSEAPPTLTAGIVSFLTALPAGDPGGPLHHVYTSAAINPGVNGGPLVDLSGSLVGTVSTYLEPLPDEPFQFLGKVVPADRLRAAYAGRPGFEEVFGQERPRTASGRRSASLERAFRYVARRAWPSVVSLEVARAAPLAMRIPVGGSNLLPVPRWQGPVSGVLVDADGWIVTSLYNLASTAALVRPEWEPPPEEHVAAGLRAIQGVTAHLADGRRAAARLVAHDVRLGIVLLRAELETPDEAAATVAHPAEPLAHAPTADLAEGRFVLALGNPFGAARPADPLLTMGILSKRHAPDSVVPWRGQWQTDASATDANCGGAVVDLRGRLVGLLQIWSPDRQGRNSGIGFVVPWSSVLEALPDLREGRSRERGWLGVRFEEAPVPARIAAVVPGSAAADSGLEAGDAITAVQAIDTPRAGDVARALGCLTQGERVRLRIARGKHVLEVDVVLGARPREGG